MKKTILARTFRGALGTNDTNEESAAGLLAIKNIYNPLQNKAFFQLFFTYFGE